MSAYQTIPMKALVPSENNYRRSFDPAALAELVASVRAKGVLQPIHVRPKGKKFEIIAGHRRHTAALEAGLTEMPSIVLNLNDEEALELQVIENTQREDPNPMDEAVGFKRLLEMGKHTPETLAEKIGHSVKYVLARTRLLGLTEEAQEAVAAGELSLGHALLLSRLKNPADQTRFLEMVQSNDGMTVKQAASRIRDFSMDLADADFSLEGCAHCMARTRNQADLFPALKDADDECMDRECYYDRTLAHWGAWLEEKSVKGFPVITSREAVPAQYGGREGSTVRISPKFEGKPWNEEYPAEYDKKCVKCKKHHAFFVYEHNEAVWHGELCLNTGCLDEMNRKAAGKKSAAQTADEPEDDRMSKWERDNAANNCLKRFLSRLVFAKMSFSPEFCKRMELALLFAHLVENGDEDAFLKEFVPSYNREAAVNSLYESDHAWSVLKSIEDERLDEGIDALIREGLKSSGDLAYMQVLSEHAGVDNTEFTIDAEYLKEFEGQDLRELVTELWPDENERPLVLSHLIALDDETIKGFILAQGDGLKGRRPKELVPEETPEEEAAPEDEDAGEPIEGVQEAAEDFDDEDAAPTAPETDPTMPKTTQTGKKKRKTKA